MNPGQPFQSSLRPEGGPRGLWKIPTEPGRVVERGWAGRALAGGALAAFLAGTHGLSSPEGVAAQDPILPPEGDPREAVLGIWEGPLEVGPDMALTIVFHVEPGEEYGLSASMDSPDQGAEGIPVAEAAFHEGVLTLEVPSIQGRFEGEAHGDRLDGVWSQAGTDFSLELWRVEEVTAPPRPQEPEPPLPYGDEDVRYRNDEAGIELAGTLTIPEGEGPFPAVALISGSGPQDRDSQVFGHRIFLVLADYLTRRGIAVLRSDDRGVGESEGSFSEATTWDFAGDSRAAAAYLRARPEVDPDAVGLVGLSEGGLVAPMVAAEWEEPAFLVLLAAPGLPGDQILFRQGALIMEAMGVAEEVIEWNRGLQERLFRIVAEEEDPEARRARLEEELRESVAALDEEERRAAGVPPDGEEQWTEGQAAQMATPWFRFFLTHDPRPVLREVRVPVLALGGELDLQVPPDENLPALEEALREGGNPDHTVEELAGLNHLFQTATTGAPTEYAGIEETMSPEAMDLVARWILERFGSDGGR